MLNVVYNRIYNGDCRERSGASAEFFKLTNNVGVKVYSTHCDANRTRRNQQYLHSVGLAPKVGKKIYEVRNQLGKMCYWYITEIATIVNDVVDENTRNVMYNFLESDNIDRTGPVNNNIIDDFVQLYHQLLNIDKAYTWDLYPRNIGYLNNKMVLVDPQNY